MPKKAIQTPLPDDTIHPRIIEFLKKESPEVFTEGNVDLEKSKRVLGATINDSRERYGLSWAGKSDCFRQIQQSIKGKTLIPCREESVNFDTSKNLFIEGDNLQVLKLLQRVYHGKVKMIYIDPPYNTGSDSFVYPDRFKEKLDEYQKRAGIKDDEGNWIGDVPFHKNTKDNGHYHSNWISMMYPRLFLARQLLRDDGVIFVSIDDNEVHNLRLIMDEIYGEENFVATFIWKSRQNKDNRNLTGASIDHEYMICYSKNNQQKALKGSERKIEQYTNPDNDPRGPWASGNMVGLLPENLRPNCHYDLIRPDTKINYGKPKMGWRYDKNTMRKLIEENRILWPRTSAGRPRRKVFMPLQVRLTE